MFPISIASLVDSLLSFYGLLIFVYVILSWFRASGVVYEIYRVLATICEPYVGLFRRILPMNAMGGIDFSPWIAVLVLQYLIRPLLVQILAALRL